MLRRLGLMGPPGFYEALAEIAEDDPDFFKISNAEPGKAFAVNLKVNLGSLGPSTTEIVGQDDYDHPVTEIPLAETSRLVTIDFLNCWFRLPTEAPAISIRQFLGSLAATITKIYSDRNASQISETSSASEQVKIPWQPPLEKVVVERIVWQGPTEEEAMDPGGWYVVFGDGAYEK
jgi:hypothetical protein